MTILPLMAVSALLMGRTYELEEEILRHELRLQGVQINEVLKHEMDLIASRMALLSTNNDIVMAATSSFFREQAIVYMKGLIQDHSLISSVYLVDSDFSVVDTIPRKLPGLYPQAFATYLERLLPLSELPPLDPYRLIDFQDASFLDQQRTNIPLPDGFQGIEALKSKYGIGIAIPLISRSSAEEDGKIRGMLVSFLPVERLAMFANSQVELPHVLDFYKNQEKIVTEVTPAASVEEENEVVANQSNDSVVPKQRIISRMSNLTFPQPNSNDSVRFQLRISAPYQIDWKTVILDDLMIVVWVGSLLLIGLAYGVAQWLVRFLQKQRLQETKALSAQNVVFLERGDGQRHSYRKKLTIFFSDIKEFTSITDNMESEQLIELLNSYLKEMVEITMSYGGTVEKLMGDSILIVFGEPETQGEKEDAFAAVQMAIEMQERMQVLQRRWQAKGVSQLLQIRMGINTGYCTVGRFDSGNRSQSSILGTQVSVAKRLCLQAKPDSILMSHSTFTLLEDKVACQKRGKIKVKGLPYPMPTYAIE